MDLIDRDNPATLRPESARARLALLLDFGTDEQIAKFAPGGLRADPGFGNPLTARVFDSYLRTLAETDPAGALAQVRKVDLGTRGRFADILSRLEIDLMIFYLRDPGSVARATQLSFNKPNGDLSRLLRVRAGDAARVLGNYDEAAKRYEEAGDTRRDTPTRAAEDQAYSLTVDSLLADGHRAEAAAKLDEWETRHPLAKLSTDFLLLRARASMAYGRWHEAQTELESYRKMLPDSLFQIDAQCFLARALAGGGQKDPARQLYQEIIQKYPRSPRAEESKQQLARL